MTYISFHNPGVLDLAALTTFGASIKEGNEPIGRFGTGLKYAIAVLLRHGQEVEIYRGLQRHTIGTRRTTIRGKEFDLVTLDGADLGLTTAVGRSWELWMALRELYANALDEGGEISEGRVIPRDGYTTIVVRGREFAEAAANLHEIYLQAPLLEDAGPIRVHAGQSKHLYFRRFRVYDLPKPSVATYDLRTDVELTEDRTLKAFHDIVPWIYGAILTSRASGVIRRALMAGPDTFEAGLRNFELWAVVYGMSPEFQAVARELYLEPGFNPSAKEAYTQQLTTSEFVEHQPTPAEQEQLAAARELVARLGYCVTEQVRLTTSLGVGVLGMVRRGKPEIWLARQAFLEGPRRLAGTLLEEHLHLAYHLDDESRPLQNFLLDLLMQTAEQLPGEPR